MYRVNKIIQVAIAMALMHGASYGWYTVKCTREGLVGGTCSNGHVIVENDWFVALPSARGLSPNSSWSKRVMIKHDDRLVICPVWDVGPWNTKDDYWNPNTGGAENRQIYSYLQNTVWPDTSKVPKNPDYPAGWSSSYPRPPALPVITQGIPEGTTAYWTSKEGPGSLDCIDAYAYGCDQYRRHRLYTGTHLNPSGIDLADGIYWSEGLSIDASDIVQWQFTDQYPAVKNVIVSQGGTVYYDHLQGINQDIPAGNVTVNVQFNLTVEEALVTLGRNAPYNEYSVSLTRTKTDYANDTFMGTVNILNEGTYTIAIQGGHYGIYRTNSFNSDNTVTYSPDVNIQHTIVIGSAVPQPDLIIIGITGDSDSVDVTIRNQGAVAVLDSFWVDVFINPVAPLPLSGTGIYGDYYQYVGAIAANASATLQIECSLTETQSVYALVDTNDAIDEASESNNSYGPLDVTFTAPAGDAYENDDSFATATLIASGVPQNNHSILEGGADEDYVKFVLTEDSIIDLTTYSASAGPSFGSDDTEIFLYNSVHGQINYADGGGLPVGSWMAGFNSLSLSAGTYYVMVKDWESGSVTGTDEIASYNISFTATPASDAYEPDDVSAQAKKITSGQNQNHSIKSVGDVDWVKFTLSRKSVVNLTTYSPAAGPSLGGDDTEMWLYDSSFTEKAYADGGGLPAGSWMAGFNDLTLRAGTYYVKIKDWEPGSVTGTDEIETYTIAFTAKAIIHAKPKYNIMQDSLEGDRLR